MEHWKENSPADNKKQKKHKQTNSETTDYK